MLSMLAPYMLKNIWNYRKRSAWSQTEATNQKEDTFAKTISPKDIFSGS